MQQNNIFITSALRVLIPVLDVDAKRQQPNRLIIIRRLVHQAQIDQFHPYQGSIGKVLYQDLLHRIRQENNGQLTAAIDKAHLFMTQDFHGDSKKLQDGRLTIITISQPADSIRKEFKKISFDKLIEHNFNLSYQSYLSKQEEKEFIIRDKSEFANSFIYTLNLCPALQQLFKTTLSPLTTAVKTTDTLGGSITASQYQNFNIYDYDTELEVSIDDSIRSEVIRQIAFLKKFVHSLIAEKENSALTEEITLEFIKFLEIGIPNFLADFDSDFRNASEVIQRQIITQVSEWQLMLIDLSTQIDELKCQGVLKNTDLDGALEVLMTLHHCAPHSADNEDKDTGFTIVMGNSKIFPQILSQFFVKYASLEINPRSMAIRKAMITSYKLKFQPIVPDAYEIHIKEAKKIITGEKTQDGDSGIMMDDLRESRKMVEAIQLLESKMQGKRVSAEPIRNPILTEPPFTSLSSSSSSSSSSTTSSLSSGSFLANLTPNSRKSKPLPLLPRDEVKTILIEIKELKEKLGSVIAKQEAISESNNKMKTLLLSRTHVPFLLGNSREIPLYSERCKLAVDGSTKLDENLLRLTEDEENLKQKISEKQARLVELQSTIIGNSPGVTSSPSS